MTPDPTLGWIVVHAVILLIALVRGALL